jgi:hypothetical protein
VFTFRSTTICSVKKLAGVINESHPSWGPQTVTNYFLARLLWNPDLDMDRAVGEFCRDYYGTGGEAMLKYHRLLNQASLAGPAWYFSGRFIDRLFAENDRLVEEMGLLIWAAQDATKGRAPFERRVHGAWAGYEVARVRNQVEHYKKENKLSEAKAAWEALGAFIQSDKSGELFDSGPVMFKAVWRTMTQEAGMG